MPKSFRPFLSSTKSYLVRKPQDEMRRILRWGPRAYFRMDAWKQEMEREASRLPPINALHTDFPGKLQPELPVWFMSGNAFWYQTMFCAWSLALHSGTQIALNILDDGTLQQWQIAKLESKFPFVTIYSASTCAEQREHLLPRSRYPWVHAVLERQILFRKLTDIFCGSSQWRLFLDSDMLFFRRPYALHHECIKAEKALVQEDCWESYGYTRELCEELTEGSQLPKAINIGVLGMRADLVDWGKIESWIPVLIEREGWKYNITQCITAMILSSQPIAFLPSAEYRVYPKKPTNSRAIRVMEHYVSDSKPFYFSTAWKQLVGKD